MNAASSSWLPLPPNLSNHGPEIDQLITLLHYLMFALFVGWGIYFIYCLVRFRQREGRRATYDPAKGKVAKIVEVGVVVAEALLLVGLSMPLWASLKNEFPEKGKALEIRVVAEQFAWNFHYPGRDGIFGRTDPKLMNNNTGNYLGLDPDDPNSRDDISTLNELHIPIDRPVIAYISSKDVIHSFTLNVLRVKQDAVPGMVIPIWFQANSTGKGSYDISCAQLCGLGHYRMRGTLYLETPEQYAKWMSERESELQGVR